MHIFRDERGEIVDFGNGFSIISSEPGAIRAKHWHRDAKSAHWCVLISGSLEYYERDTGTKQLPSKKLIQAPASFYTEPRIEHQMNFLEKSVMICKRNADSMTPEEYEQGTVKFNHCLKEEHDKQNSSIKPVAPTVWPEQA